MFRTRVEPIKNDGVTEKPNFFFDGNWFFTIMKVFGCFSIVKIDGRVQFYWFCWTTFYTVAFNCFWIGYTGWCSRVVILNLLQMDFSFEEMVFYCLVLGTGVGLVVPILTFVESRKFAEYIEAWADFQELFERLTKKKLLIKYHHHDLVNLLIIPIVMMLVTNDVNEKFQEIISKYQLDATAHFIMVRALMYMAIIISIYGYLWFLLCRTITTATEALIRDVESLRWTANHSIRNHIILWLQLRQLCLRLGTSLSWTYSYVAFSSYSFALPALYVGSVQIQEGNFSMLFAAVNTLICITAVAELAHQAVNKVSAELETRVTALIGKMNENDCMDELLRFEEKIATHPLVVYLGGFFPLNRSINTGMYSSVITYLIIIIQFRGNARGATQQVNIH